MEFRWPKDFRRLQLVGLVVLGVVTLIVSVLALTRYRAPVPQAATPAPHTQDATSWPAEPEPTPEPEPLTPLQEVGLRLGEPGASVMVVGDGTGNEDDEWVAVWARDYLAIDRGVNYRLWDRYGLRWSEPVAMGQGPADLDVWNASVLAPEMTQEPARVQAAWQPVSAVFLSYGHWRDPATVGAELTAILDVIRTQDPEVPVVVILQNPGPWSVAAAQEASVRAVDEWAQHNGLPTVDVYNGFPADQGQRDALLEADGSPTLDGSRLYASIVASALAPAA
ncbi:MAG: SGNH/GDSL hydrolase family protein [Brooklawnia sp.]|uniref:SGNH/GDSL hydrolase family protein n=1 Tax=Brooklawnia sp. TaxID=2699740 RepID=UPI003C781B2A